MDNIAYYKYKKYKFKYKNRYLSGGSNYSIENTIENTILLLKILKFLTNLFIQNDNYKIIIINKVAVQKLLELYGIINDVLRGPYSLPRLFSQELTDQLDNYNQFIKTMYILKNETNLNNFIDNIVYDIIDSDNTSTIHTINIFKLSKEYSLFIKLYTTDTEMDEFKGNLSRAILNYNYSVEAVQKASTDDKLNDEQRDRLQQNLLKNKDNIFTVLAKIKNKINELYTIKNKYKYIYSDEYLNQLEKFAQNKQIDFTSHLQNFTSHLQNSYKIVLNNKIDFNKYPYTFSNNKNDNKISIKQEITIPVKDTLQEYIDNQYIGEKQLEIVYMTYNLSRKNLDSFKYKTLSMTLSINESTYNNTIAYIAKNIPSLINCLHSKLARINEKITRKTTNTVIHEGKFLFQTLIISRKKCSSKYKNIYN